MQRGLILVVLWLGMALGMAQSLLTDGLQFQDQIDDLQRENALLKQHASELEAEVTALRHKLAANNTPSSSTPVAGTATPPGTVGPASVTPATPTPAATPVPAGTPTPAPAAPGTMASTSTTTSTTTPVKVEDGKTTEIVPDADLNKVRASLWKHEISLAGSLNSGNTNSYGLRIKEQSDRETKIDKYHFDLIGEYKEAAEVTVTDRAKGTFQYDRTIDDHWYGLARSSAETDEILQLTYRLQLGPGVGYYFIKNDKVTFAIETGPAAQAEKFHALPEHNTIQGRIVDKFNWQITPKIRFFQNADFSTDVAEVGDYVANFEAGFQSAVTQKLSFRLSAEDRYNAEPPIGLQKNDIGLITSLVFDF